MRLSATDVYALQALAYLGTRAPELWTGREGIGEATGVPRPYLARVLATLSASGIVVSKKGLGGGYALARPAREINLREVMRAIDGPVAPLACVSLNWHKECPAEVCCRARNRVWLRVRDALLAALAEVTVADLAEDVEQGVSYALCLERLLSPTVSYKASDGA